MTPPKTLRLYEEILLLAQRDEKGTATTSWLEYAVAGAALADLLFDHRISVDDTRKQLVTCHNTLPTRDPILDECLERIGGSKRRASLKTWLSRLAGIKNLRHKVARLLCDRGILRADEDKVLFIFTRHVYPEIDPVPEDMIVERLRAAIFGDDKQLDPRTVVLISLATGADLLSGIFKRKDLKTRTKRIEQIVNGEMTGKATREVVQACQAAVLTTVMMSAMVATTSH